jgi:hypothetical protein
MPLLFEALVQGKSPSNTILIYTLDQINGIDLRWDYAE